MEIGDIVVVKEDAPGYSLHYQGKRGLIVAETTNDEGEPRFLVTFPRDESKLPFGEWELIKVGREIRKIGGSDTKWKADTIEERRKEITALVNRPIDFDVILSYAHHGKEVTCELCGNKERGGYWCKPCIHHNWCCVCCILLGIPNYATGVYIMPL